VKNLLIGNNVKHPSLTVFVMGPLILDQYDGPLTCADRLCEQCGEDHDLRPRFDVVKTSMDMIPTFLEKLKTHESKESF
jgi:hypothetical protein